MNTIMAALISFSIGIFFIVKIIDTSAFSTFDEFYAASIILGITIMGGMIGRILDKLEEERGE